jgi:LSD1 subclass zinc finger protein
MPVTMLCPNLRCRKILSVPDGVRGKLVKCQHCQTAFRVPDRAGAHGGAGAAKVAQAPEH